MSYWRMHTYFSQTNFQTHIVLEFFFFVHIFNAENVVSDEKFDWVLLAHLHTKSFNLNETFHHTNYAILWTYLQKYTDWIEIFQRISTKQYSVWMLLRENGLVSVFFVQLSFCFFFCNENHKMITIEQCIVKWVCCIQWPEY